MTVWHAENLKRKAGIYIKVAIFPLKLCVFCSPNSCKESLTMLNLLFWAKLRSRKKEMGITGIKRWKSWGVLTEGRWHHVGRRPLTLNWWLSVSQGIPARLLTRWMQWNYARGTLSQKKLIQQVTVGWFMLWLPRFNPDDITSQSLWLISRRIFIVYAPFNSATTSPQRFTLFIYLFMLLVQLLLISQVN